MVLLLISGLKGREGIIIYIIKFLPNMESGQILFLSKY